MTTKNLKCIRIVENSSLKDFVNGYVVYFIDEYHNSFVAEYPSKNSCVYEFVKNDEYIMTFRSESRISIHSGNSYTYITHIRELKKI